MEAAIGGDENAQINDNYSKQTTTIVVVVVILVLLLIIGVAVGLFYARKKKRCCFASQSNKNLEKGAAGHGASEDHMTVQPLNHEEGLTDEGDKTSRPIIKKEWARPE